MPETISITHTTKGKPPRLPFLLYKNTVLGKNYELSVVFVGEQKIKSLNRIYRNMDKATDILSFSLDERHGEIFVSEKVAKKKAKIFDRPYANFLSFLFIHGLVHLKGFDHGTRMERLEISYRKKFGV